MKTTQLHKKSPNTKKTWRERIEERCRQSATIRQIQKTKKIRHLDFHNHNPTILKVQLRVPPSQIKTLHHQKKTNQDENFIHERQSILGCATDRQCIPMHQQITSTSTQIFKGVGIKCFETMVSMLPEWTSRFHGFCKHVDGLVQASKYRLVMAC